MLRFLSFCVLILLSFTGCNNHRTTIFVPMPDGVQLRCLQPLRNERQ